MSTAKNVAKAPEVQLIANAVISDGAGRVLLTRYRGDGDERWWLPGAQLQPYEHPDEALQRALDGLAPAAKTDRGSPPTRCRPSRTAPGKRASSRRRLAVERGGSDRELFGRNPIENS